MDTAPKIAIPVPINHREFNQFIFFVEETLSWTSFDTDAALEKFYFIPAAIDMVYGMPRHVAVSALCFVGWIKIQHRRWESLDVALFEHFNQRF
ncbi:hypothetical protein SAMCFNEI73_Ch2255 [Sinorhizobium americanum]|uniref:Uncharacterized protein n=1 Tax=Sinorhizobium americanum TaxID=194963 RepID=A0A1L3LN63_9HYPH|nr:hypothetical protein SAMCFNEI73_Ch2255 [Sinorhizobium americanum]